MSDKPCSCFASLDLSTAELAQWRAEWHSFLNRDFSEIETAADRAWYRRPVSAS